MATSEGPHLLSLGIQYICANKTNATKILMGLLRFLLAISVVIAHSSSIFGIKLIGGQLAVQAFYMISGFYMTLILNEKYIDANNSYKLFISNRLLRLFPIYWTVLIIVIASALITAFHTEGTNLGALNYYNEYSDKINFGGLIFLIFTNIFLVFQDVVMFLGLDADSGNLFFTSDFWKTNPMLWKFLLIPQAWSIGIEIMFYVIAPFLVRKKLKIILLLISLSFSLRLILYFGFKLQNDPWTYRFFPTELLFFLLGTISYHLYKKYQNLKLRTNFLLTIWTFILFFTITYGWINFQFKEYFYLFVFFISLPFIFILSKNWKRDIIIGELSYPIYISHWSIMTTIEYYHFPTIGEKGLIISITTIIFAFFLNEFVAKKVEKIRQKRFAKNSS